MKLKIRPGPEFSLVVKHSPQAFRRLLVIVLVAWVAIGVGLYLGAEAAAARWAPAAGHQTTGLLVVFVWITQLVAFLRRTRSLLGAVRDGLLYSIGLAALLVAAIHHAG